MPIEQIMFIAAGLLGLSVLASKASGMLGVPSLVLFLAIGMLAGADGPGRIYFDDARLSQAVGVVALSFILFSGGLDTSWPRVRPIAVKGLVMATVGVFITAACVALFAVVVLRFTVLEGFLLGAVISSTDAAAVFSVMRMRNVRLQGDLEPLIEFESGSNDPMAVLLTLGVITLIQAPTTPALNLITMFVMQLTLGAGLGFLIGHGAAWCINRLRLNADGLYVIITITVVLLTYSATTLLQGNGFLAIYVCGIVLGNTDFIHKRSLTRFHDGLAWIMQIVMFLTLGLLVFPSQLMSLAGVAVLMALFLIFVARPVSVFLSLIWARMHLRELLLVSWVGLRGAAPIIMATFPLLAGIDKANTIFNLVFFVVLTSVLIQGTTVGPVARWLRLNNTDPKPEKSPIELTENVRAELSTVKITPVSPVVGQQIVDLHLPERLLVILIERNGKHFIPTGATTIESGDTLTILSNRFDLAKAREWILKC
jgi:cell volume regulation protein A